MTTRWDTTHRKKSRTVSLFLLPTTSSKLATFLHPTTSPTLAAFLVAKLEKAATLPKTSMTCSQI
jgi:hypothetical protein